MKSTLQLGLAGALLFALAARGGAVELPSPEQIQIYRDGAVMTYRFTLPAGTHRLAVPEQGLWQINDAQTWAVRSEEIVHPAPPMPERLVPLVTQRNALRDQALILHHHLRSEEQVAQHWTARAFVSLTDSDPQQWQALIQRWDDSRERHLQLRQQLQQSHGEMLQALKEAIPLLEAAGAVPDPRDPTAALRVILDMDAHPLALAERQRLDQATAKEHWARRFNQRRERRHHLIIGLAEAGEVVLTRGIDGSLSWQPAQRLRIAGDTVVLHREAVIQGGSLIPLDTQVELVEAFRSRGLDAPQPPQVIANLQPAAVAERREVIAHHQALRWADGGRQLPSAASHNLGPWKQTMYEQRELRLALPQGRQELEVLHDRWILFPPQMTLARRQLLLRLPQGLQGGHIELERDGLPLGSTRVAAVAAEGELSIFLERDEHLFASSVNAWPEDPQRSSVRRREGMSVTLHNLSQSPRRIDLLLTQPVSNHELVAVLRAENSSPDGIEEQPGLWRYRLDLPAASHLKVEHGWILNTNGDAVLSP
ncbi:MAG: hypothetical protein EA402_03570 [Planctomycetota bacterium]|nr:MAG: hypothetical protein EA402_03570 [Planctomycetota bacterium]